MTYMTLRLLSPYLVISAAMASVIGRMSCFFRIYLSSTHSRRREGELHALGLRECIVPHCAQQLLSQHRQLGYGSALFVLPMHELSRGLSEVRRADHLVERLQRERDRATQVLNLGKHGRRIGRGSYVDMVRDPELIPYLPQPLVHCLDIVPHAVHRLDGHTVSIVEVGR